MQLDLLARWLPRWKRSEHCEMKRGARSFVFSDGNPAARVMIIGEALAVKRTAQAAHSWVVVNYWTGCWT
jgi:uracil-DNA glycosylase